MKRSRCTVSGRSRFGRPDVVWGIALAFAFAACDAPAVGGDRTETLELEADTVSLEPGVTVADVLLRADPRDPIEPDTLGIRVGDVVRFTAADASVHAVAFDRERLTPEASAYLERTGQLRSPPLISRGARWIVSFENAPPGAYPFTDTNRDTRGLIVVVAHPPRT